MKIFLLTLFLISYKQTSLIEKEIKTFGFYSNVLYNSGENPVGYTLQLWKYNNSIIGKFIYNEGYFGVNTSSFIENVKYNPEKKTFRFESNLNCTIVKFRGELHSTKIVGNFTWPNRINKNISLEICCLDSEINVDFNTFSEWLEMWKQLK